MMPRNGTALRTSHGRSIEDPDSQRVKNLPGPEVSLSLDERKGNEHLSQVYHDPSNIHLRLGEFVANRGDGQVGLEQGLWAETLLDEFEVFGFDDPICDHGSISLKAHWSPSRVRITDLRGAESIEKAKAHIIEKYGDQVWKPIAQNLGGEDVKLHSCQYPLWDLTDPIIDGNMVTLLAHWRPSRISLGDILTPDGLEMARKALKGTIYDNEEIFSRKAITRQGCLFRSSLPRMPYGVNHDSSTSYGSLCSTKSLPADPVSTHIATPSQSPSPVRRHSPILLPNPNTKHFWWDARRIFPRPSSVLSRFHQANRFYILQSPQLCCEGW